MFLQILFSSLWYGASPYLPAPLPCDTGGKGRSLFLPVPLLCGMGESLFLQAPLPCGTGKSYLQAPSPLGMIPLRNMLVLIGKSVMQQHRIIPDSASPTNWIL